MSGTTNGPRPGRLVFGLVLLAVLAALALVPVELVERLPTVCLNRRLFGFCPGCGTVRALSHLLHGDVAGALRHNFNCLIVAPLLVGLAAWYVVTAVKRRDLKRSG
ncbi:MAG: DUF2752 domain-containing protein [candidate division WOR-3 bacterium]